MKLILGTESKLKLSAVNEVINEFTKKGVLKEEVSILSRKVNHNFPFTPYDDDIYALAKKRVDALKEQRAEGDLYVALESGLIERYGVLYEECWCVIANNQNKLFSGYSSGLAVPEHIVERMKKGEKHSEVIDSLGEINTKETWTVYTNGAILREKSIEEAFRNAFYYAVTS